MNRRNFLGGLFAILPAATCYKRIWKEIAKTEIPAGAVINPAWVNAPYEIEFYYRIDLTPQVEAYPIRMRMVDEEKIIPGSKAWYSEANKIQLFKRELS